MFDRTRGNLFSRIRELTLPKAERQATRAERRQRESERLAAKRAAAVHAESLAALRWLSPGMEGVAPQEGMDRVSRARLAGLRGG